MTHVPTCGAHAEAYCSTGTSPGVSHAAPSAEGVGAELDLTHLGRVRVRIRWERLGEPGAPAVVVLGGISATAHLGPTEDDPRPGWWPGVVGAGLGLDPAERTLLGVEWLGAPGDEALPEGAITPRDQAAAVRAVLDHLDLERVDLVGASYGGMVSLAFAAAWPERVRRLAVLCAAHRPHPWATALRRVQRGILALAERGGRGWDGVVLARGLAMASYRSAQEFDARFGHRPAAAFPQKRPGPAPESTFPVDGYLRATGERFAQRFDARAFARLSESIDLHDVDPTDVVVPTDLLSVHSDLLSPPWLVGELAARAPGVRRHVSIPSIFGHDAFLKETRDVSAFLGSWLAGPEVVR